jgi:ATP phosphoribosyltransferase
MSVIEGRAAGRRLCSLRWPVGQHDAASAAVAGRVAGGMGGGAPLRPDGMLVQESELFDVAGALAAAGVGPVTVTRPDYVFEARCLPVEQLRARLGR